MAAETALVVEVGEAEAAVEGWRRAHDPSAAAGMPAHITVLYPFVPPELFDESVADKLAEVIGSMQPIGFDLPAVDEFPGAVWLRPEPDQPFRDVTRAVWAAFPDYPPYGGAYPDSQPHLTVAVVSDDANQATLGSRIRSELESSLPIRCRAAAVSVFTRVDGGRWRVHRRFDLGASG